jgi:hypothetical protein
MQAPEGSLNGSIRHVGNLNRTKYLPTEITEVCFIGSSG